MNTAQMNACQMASALREGKFTAVDLVQACLDQIAQVEDRVGAWQYLDPDYALEQAQNADLARHKGQDVGPLNGIPVGIKDIFDTADMPTENGTVLHAGRQPEEDATVVSLLRRAGAVILGKTVTAELAVYSPGKTTNPHDSRRTPGGSSSGSAAAMAADMIPLALGTQTNGSVVRPASYCGVYGYKPTHGLISRQGVLHQSYHLDQIGVFARSVADTALLAQQLMAFDQLDPDVKPRSRPRLLATALQEPPTPPRLAFIKSPVWHEASQDTQAAFLQFVEKLGPGAIDVELPDIFESAVQCHRTIMLSDLANSYARLYLNGKAKISAELCALIEEGQQCKATDYSAAVEKIPVFKKALKDIFDSFDAILTPAATGEAPVGLESTGSPIFCTIWTLCGVPAISLPLLTGPSGMPLGVQLTAAGGDDGRLLRTARWLVQICQDLNPAIG
jgi:Asp-tRNA(Asn)/Glu-tRNA(Gln) amidotransferase A subunit family amidase